jgi:hypothetical protein
VPGKAGGARPSTDEVAPAKFRRPADELIRRAARRVVRGGRASFTSQAAFRSAILAVVRRDEPLATVGGKRLRRLLIDVPGVRLTVRYTERADDPLPAECPVCGGGLDPIRNRTLTGDSIVLGRRCRRCDYWTHGKRRVPVRYLFFRGGIDGRPLTR